MIVISAIVCLAIAMVLFAAWSRTLVLEQRLVHAQQTRVQAELLARSGVQRAASRLAADAAYAGETWQVDGGELGTRGGATVVIQVESLPERPEARRVRAQAAAGENGGRRWTEEAVIVVEQSGETS
jgi:hypothetical protein